MLKNKNMLLQLGAIRLLDIPYQFAVDLNPT